MLALITAIVAAAVVDIATGASGYRDYRIAALRLAVQALPAFMSDLYEVGFVGATIALAIRNIVDPLGYNHWLRFTGQIASPRRE